MAELLGKTALVTGAARNIGAQIALTLAQQGADVVINANTSIDEANDIAQRIRDLGRQSTVVQADIADSAQATRLVDEAAAMTGRLDIVVLNAAIRRQTPIEDITDEDWREVRGVALDGAFYVCRASVKHLRAAGAGRIVFIGGSPSHMGSPGRAHVCAAKMGAVGLMRTLATELGRDDVTCNTVAPGHIDTSRGGAAGTRSATGTGRPIVRKGSTEEISQAVLYLCSNAAAYTTGQTLHVNGGMLFG